MKRKLLIAAVITVAAIIIAGCGGAPASEPAQQQSQQDQQQTEQPAPQLLAKPIELPAKFEVNKTTPLFFKEAIEKKQPLLVFFYQEGDTISDRVKKNISEISSKPQYSDVIFLALNIEKPEHIFGLLEPLGVTYAPFIAILDSDGVIRYEFAGYVDEQTIEQALYNVSASAQNYSVETTSNQ